MTDGAIDIILISVIVCLVVAPVSYFLALLTLKAEDIERVSMGEPPLALHTHLIVFVHIISKWTIFINSAILAALFIRKFL